MTSSTPLPTWASPAQIPPLPPDQLALRLERLADLRASDFQAWRHHPVSRALLQFLADYRDERFREAIVAWMGGGLTTAIETEGRGRALMADELVALEWEHILRFYGVSPPTEEESEP